MPSRTRSAPCDAAKASGRSSRSTDGKVVGCRVGSLAVPRLGLAVGVLDRDGNGGAFGILDVRDERLAGDQARATAMGEKAPRPADRDHDPVREPDQIHDVNAEPE